MQLSDEEQIAGVMEGREALRNMVAESVRGDESAVEFLRTTIAAYCAILDDEPIALMEKYNRIHGANMEAEFLLKQMTYAE